MIAVLIVLVAGAALSVWMRPRGRDFNPTIAIFAAIVSLLIACDVMFGFPGGCEEQHAGDPYAIAECKAGENVRDPRD